MPSPSTHLEIVPTIEGLRGLGPQWDRLAARFSTPVLTHDWFLAALSTLHPSDLPRVFVLRSGGDVVAIAPLVERRRLGMRSLEFIGSAVLCEPSGILYDHPIHLRRVLEGVAASGIPAKLSRVGDPVLTAELTSIAGGSVAPVRKSLATSPWIRIDGSWKAFYQTITPKWRSAHRRAVRKADAEGKVEYELLTPGPDEFGPLMDRFVAVEGESWKARLGTALRTDPRLRTFFEDYGREAARRGMLRLSFLRIGGVPVAAQYSLVYGGRYWLLKIGYDERYAHCSPGILLMYRVLERAFDDGLASVEFLGSNESWIQIWSPRLRKYHSRTIDRVRARRLLRLTLAFSDRLHATIRTRIARTRAGRAGVARTGPGS